MVLSFAEVSGTSWTTSQCSTIFPFRRTGLPSAVPERPGWQDAPQERLRKLAVTRHNDAVRRREPTLP
ncbi:MULTISPECIES: hypothetical protein [unclassified Streptomyces]|uniref:hypothetical protein n=1 Tax=unclassified Streptomyces TaxID=2593676 RepID=UPI0033ACECA3